MKMFKVLVMSADDPEANGPHTKNWHKVLIADEDGSINAIEGTEGTLFDSFLDGMRAADAWRSFPQNKTDLVYIKDVEV